MITTTDQLANVPLPAGHTQLGSWQRDTGTGLWFRRFTGQCRVVELPDNPDHDLYVRVAGEQHADGRIDRWVEIEHAAVPLDAGQAKALARCLIAAADEMVQDGDRDTITVS